MKRSIPTQYFSTQSATKNNVIAIFVYVYINQVRVKRERFTSINIVRGKTFRPVSLGRKCKMLLKIGTCTLLKL